MDTPALEALCLKATTLFQRDETRTESHNILKFVVDQQPDNQVALWYLSQSELLNGNAIAAARLAARLATHSTSSVAVLALVRALIAEGKSGEALAAVQHHLARGGAQLDRRAIAHDDLINLLLLEITGQSGDADALSSRMCREDDVALLDWSSVSQSWIDLPVLDRLQKSLSGRDIAIFGRGPSLSQIHDHLDQFRSLDFITFVINDFSELNKSVLAPIGKTPELICFTNYDLLRNSIDLVIDSLDSENFLALCLPTFIHNELLSRSDDREFRARLLSSRRLFFFDVEKEAGLPMPSDPLMFPCVNTLICAIGVAVLSAPRRIFMFGFDGQAQERTGSYYYGDQTTDYTRGAPEDVQRHTRQWLWWDAFRFNHIAPCFIRNLHHLHNVDVPIVYNVCPDSAITCFPRIGIGECIDILRSVR